MAMVLLNSVDMTHGVEKNRRFERVNISLLGSIWMGLWLWFGLGFYRWGLRGGVVLDRFFVFQAQAGKRIVERLGLGLS